MAKFCTKCGAQLDDGTVFCTVCGEKLDANVNNQTAQAVTNQPADQGDKSMLDSFKENVNMETVKNFKNNPNFNLIVGAGVVVVAAIVVIALLVSLIGGGGYKGAISDYFNAIENADGKKLMNTYPKFAIKAMEDDLDDDEDIKDYFNDRADGLQDSLKEEYGKIKSISYKITDKDELSDKRLKLLKTAIKSQFDTKKVKVTKGYEVELDVKIKGKDSKDTVTYEGVVVKANGDWFVMYMADEDSGLTDLF